MTGYEVYELIVGKATADPRQVWGVSCVIECECPNCEIGEQRVDAFNRGTSVSWYETLEEATAAMQRLR